MPLPLFQKIVADAAVDAHRDARVLRVMTQAADHPIHLAIPESWYLKGLVCRVD
jgi:23S rRNA (cytosine1962-C5)-methyltransferase